MMEKKICGSCNWLNIRNETIFCVPIPGLSARTSGRSQEVVMGKNQQQNKVKLNMIMNVIT